MAGLKQFFKGPGSWMLLALLIAVVTLARLLVAYDDFRDEVLSAKVALAALIVLNIVVIGAVVALVASALKPEARFRYTIAVVLSFPLVVATPLAVSTITGEGAQVPGKPESVKLSDVYGPYEDWLKGDIEKPVREAKTARSPRLSTATKTSARLGKRI